MTNETHPELFKTMIALRDLLTRAIDANFVSDSSYDTIDSICHDMHVALADAYENDDD